jgi:hypothetical protein
MNGSEGKQEEAKALFSLVRIADPVADSTPSRPDEMLFQKIVSTPRQTGEHRRRRLSQHQRILLASGVIVAILGTSAALGSGLLGTDEGTRIVGVVASSSGVTDVHTLSRSSNGHASVVEAINNSNSLTTANGAAGINGAKPGESVAAVTIGGSSTPFVPLDKLLTGRDISARTGAGGSAGSVDWLAASGVVSTRVAEVLIEGKAGVVQKVDLASGTFAIELDPSFHPTAIVAFDKAGNEIGRVPFLEAQAPPIQ